MKLAHLLFAASLAALLASAPAAYAQHDHTKDHDAAPKAATTAHPASGVVKSVNAEKGIVTIAHGPVPSLQWPAMTMSFKVADPKILEQLKPGQKIGFEFVQEGKAYIVTRVQ